MAQYSDAELAQSRTDMSEDRTILANERTFSGWLRTGFGAIGVGLAANVLFNRIEPSWVPKSIATAFLAIAILIFVAAERRDLRVLVRLHAHRIEAEKLSAIRVITIVIVTATALLIAAIWLLEFK
ncbi:MAG: DUF202 domain-containing protein [Sphingomicrobium sp.]